MFGRKKPESDKDEPQALLHNVLLVVDGSEPSIAAAHFAVEMATQFGSEITAVYIVDTATMDYLLQMHIFISEERQEFERDLRQTGQRYLDYVTTIAKKENITVDTILEHGSLHKTILKIARERQTDAIIIGGWRRTVTRKDATSVERQLILDQAFCPVIVIKTEDAPRDSSLQS